MNSKQIKASLETKDVFHLLEYLEARPRQKEGIIISKTVCHEGHKHKLYYYEDNKTFVCYTGSCGSMDIFSLIENKYDCNFFKSLKFIQSFFNISGDSLPAINNNHSFNPAEYVNQQIDDNDVQLEQLPVVNPNVLNSYYDLAFIDWINEGINTNTIDKYSIKLSIIDQQIIIPHFDEGNNLVGVRCRNLNQQELDEGRKYMPVKYNNQVLSYPTGKLLYGLNINKKMINQSHKIILFESEKSVLKLDSYVGDKNIAVGINGSNLTPYQIKMIRQLNVDEVIVAFDKEFKKPYTTEEHIYAEKIESECVPMLKDFKVSLLWDTKDELDYKDSPIDKGFSTFRSMLSNRIFL